MLAVGWCEEEADRNNPHESRHTPHAHLARVLRESNDREPRRRVPQLDLSIPSARGKEPTVGPVCDASQVLTMTLLSQHVRLRLPLPDEELPERSAAKRKPFSRCVDGRGGDTVLGHAKSVDVVEVGHFVQTKHTVGEPHHEHVCRTVQLRTNNLKDVDIVIRA